MENLALSWVDLIILGVLLISGLLALMRGFVRELLHILAWIAAAVIAVKAFPYAQPVVAQYLQPELLANLATGAGIFVVSLVILVYVFSTISKRVKESDVGVIDRGLGFLFGLARGVLVVALAYLVLVQFLPADESEEPPSWVAESRGLPYVAKSAEFLASVAPEVFAAALDTIEEAGGAAQMLLEEGAITSAQDPAPSSEKRNEAGYQATPRQQMDRLIDSQQPR